MTDNVYENGEPDRRVDPDLIAPTRFRPRYRKLSEDEIILLDDIKAKAAELETLYRQAQAKNGRYHALAITELESSIMWIVKAITS